MEVTALLRCLLIVACLSLCYGATCPGPLSNKLLAMQPPAPADSVIGHPSFTAAFTPPGPQSSSSLFLPTGIAISPVTGKLFVSDVNRVLRFPATTDTQVGGVAEAVLGQKNYNGTQTGCTQSLLNFPTYMYVDQSDSLWVSDSSNNRILRYDNASFIASGSPASGVLGQPNFTICSNAISATKMHSPQGLWVESDGTLWVADSQNYRILRFNNARSKPNGGSADGVLGQNGFTTVVPLSDDTSVVLPISITVDNQGNLYVGDTSLARVLRFDNAKTKTNRTVADGLYGRESFMSGIPGNQPNQYLVPQPQGLAVDDCQNLWVADGTFNRVVLFSNSLLGTGYPAETYVLGQTSFTSNIPSSPVAAYNFGFMFGQIFFDITNQRLYVVDQNNNRVLAWTTPATSLTTTTTSGSQTTTQGQSSTSTNASPASTLSSMFCRLFSDAF